MRPTIQFVVTTALLVITGAAWSEGTNTEPIVIEIDMSDIHIPEPKDQSLPDLSRLGSIKPVVFDKVPSYYSATLIKDFELCPTNRANDRFGIKLISIDTNGLATFNLTQFNKSITASPTNFMGTNYFGRYGMYLYNTDYKKQSAKLKRTWAESGVKYR